MTRRSGRGKSRVIGREAVDLVFDALPEEVRQDIALALTKSAEDIAKRARAAAPRGESRLGDALHDDIAVIRPGVVARTGKGGAARRSVVFYITAGNSRRTAEKAYRQEFGRAPGPDGHPGHAPQPFMFPAYWARRKSARARIKRAIAKAAKDAAARSRAAGRGA